MEWQSPNPPIDLASVNDKLYICCQDGVYELDKQVPMDLDDDDLFGDIDEKRHCPGPSFKETKQDALLKVKFKKEALCFCLKDNVLFSLHKKNQTCYVEATDLETFQCINPTVYLFQPQVATENPSKDGWMIYNNGSLIIHISGSTLIGKLSNDLTLKDIKELDEIKAKLDLYASNILQRPQLASSCSSHDLIEGIIDGLTVEMEGEEKGLKVCDINFVSHDLVLIVVDKGQLLQYQKNGKSVCKTEIPISHVSLTRQGRHHKECFVMTTYGAIYRLSHLPYASVGCGDNDPDTDSNFITQDPVGDILKCSKQLKFFNDKKNALETFMSQLSLALKDQFDLKAQWRICRKELKLTLWSDSQVFYGQFWTLNVVIKSHHWCFPMPMHKLETQSKWTVKILLDFDISIHDLPLNLEASLIFKKDNLRLQCRPWLSTSLTSLDFLQINSTLDAQDPFNSEVQCQDETFEGFLQSLSRKRQLFKSDSVQNDQKSVVVSLPNFDKIRILQTEEKTLYAELLGQSVFMNLDKESFRVTIRGGSKDHILKIKEDMLACYKIEARNRSLTRSKFLSVQQLKDTIEDTDGDNDEKLNLCYKMLRQL